ncbi:MAG: hypothetical protein ACOZQL_04895 [Myxococcota bacterium]
MADDEKPPASDPRAEQEQLIAELERDLARPGVGLLPPVALVAMLAGLAIAWWMRADAQYFFSSQTPIELGAEGVYQLERAVSNRYAQIHGVPTVRGWYVEEKDGSFVVVGLMDTPVLVKRVTFEDENRRYPDGKRPQPRQNPFFARGRLLSRADAVRYEEVFREYEAWSGTKASWLLIAETPPGRDFGNMGLFSFMLLFSAVNGWLFVRGLTLRRR